MTWPMVALGHVSQIISGATPRTSEKRYWDGDVLWTTPKDISDLDAPYLDCPPRTITDEGLRSCAASILPPNSVLLSSRAPIGLVAINRRPVATNQGFKSLVPDGARLDTKFLYHWLRSKTAYLQSLGNGATFKEISKAIVERIEMPLPPLPEQRRIAGILDKADALRRKRKRAIELLDGLKQSIFVEMFGRGQHPSEPITELADLQVGFAFKSSEYTDACDGIKLCRGTNVLPGEIDWSDLARWPKARADDFSSFDLRVGDVVIAMDRPWISSGFKAAQITEMDVPSLLVQRVARLRAKQETDRAYLFAIVNSAEFSQHLKPTETTVPHISPVEIRQYAAPIPSDQGRASFSAAISKVEEMRIKARRALEEAASLFASLQSRAFSGKL